MRGKEIKSRKNAKQPTSKDYAAEAERSGAGRGEDKQETSIAEDGSSKGSKEKESLRQMTWGRGDLKQTGLGVYHQRPSHFFLFWLIQTQVVICTVKKAQEPGKAQPHEGTGT